MAVLIRRLEEQDEVAAFDYGDEALNNYLKRHAWANQQKSSIGVTYVALDEGAPLSALGYFTLATASVPRDAFPKKYVRGLPPYDLPLILLARLAVDRRFSGKGLGHALISEAFKIALRVADALGLDCFPFSPKANDPVLPGSPASGARLPRRWQSRSPEAVFGFWSQGPHRGFRYSRLRPPEGDRTLFSSYLRSR